MRAIIVIQLMLLEDRFCSSRKGVVSGCYPGDTAWRLAAVAVGGWNVLVCTGWAIFLSCTDGCRKHSWRFYFWHCRQLLVWRSVLWSEGPDYWMLTNEWVWLRSWTPRECVDKALTQVFSVSSKQKWKHEPRKVLQPNKNLRIAWISQQHFMVATFYGDNLP